MIWFWIWRRRPGWHPFIFMLGVGTLVVSLVHLDVLPALAAFAVVLWTLRAAGRG